MHSLAPNMIPSDLVVKRTHVIVSHRITINKTQAQIFSWKAVALLAAKSRCSQTQGRFWSHFAARLLLKSVWMLQGGKRACHSIKQMLCVRLHQTEAGGCKRELKNQKLLQTKKKKRSCEIITYKKGPYKADASLLVNTFGRETCLTDGSNDNPLPA